MPKHTNLKRRGSKFHFRVRVPADLVPALGRNELARSLRTSDPAEARRLAATAAHLAHEIFTEVRHDPSMTAAEIDALIQKFFQAELDEHRLLTASAALSPRAAEQKAREDARRPKVMAMLAGDLATGQTRLVQSIADDLLELEGKTVERDSPAYEALCRGLLKAWLEASHQITDGITVEPATVAFLPAPPAPAPLPVVAPAPSAPSSSRALSSDGMKPLSDLLPDYLKKRGLDPRTEKEAHVAVRMVEEFLGPKPICDITRIDMIAYRKFLEDAPANATQRFPGMTLPQAAAANRKRKEPLPTMGAKVINDKWLAHLKTMFNWAVKDCLIAENPASGIKVELGKRAAKKDARDPFSPQQLTAIFNAPAFVGCKSDARLFQPGSHIVRDYRFWAPLFALFTGARPSELAQIEIADVIQRNGVWLLNITEQTDDEDADGIKSLKTVNARRLIPIHPELIRLGALDYFEAQKAKGAKRLFEEWTRDAAGSFISSFPRWFNRTFLPGIDIKTPRTVFYSFRHNFRDAMRRASIHPEVQNALFGHADTSTGAIYGHGAKVFSIQQLSDAIASVRYEDLDLTHLYA